MRIDNLPNTAVEALACGTSVAFDTCGLPDVVVHEETGFRARPFEPDDLARGIRWTVDDAERSARPSHNARAFAEERCAAPREAARCVEPYEAASASTAGGRR